MLNSHVRKQEGVDIMRFFILWVWAAAMLLSGCATEKYYALTDTDTKNGTVRLSYDFTMLERPEIPKNAQPDALAGQKCLALGYAKVEMQPRQETRCVEKSSSGDYCANTRVSRVYQCAGGGAGERLQQQEDLKMATSSQQLSQSLRYLYYAEQFAREQGCSTALKPKSISTSEEVYSTACDGRQAFIACNRAGCSSR
jgi:hypothetical protein